MRKIIFTAIACLLAFVSCDLERTPLTSLSEETFWDNSSNAELALVAIYRGDIASGVEYSPSDFWSYHGLLFTEHLSDNAFDRRGEGNAFYRITSGYLTASNSFVERYWDCAYSRIGRCNRFIEGIASAEDSESKTRMMAEARFLRAAHYQYLASYFKDVPLVTTVLSGEEANSVSKETQANILAWCATEFEEAAADLPDFSEITSSETGRACKQAALAFLGRVQMLQEDWSGAAATYKEIIDLGSNSLHSKYSELFWPGTGVGNSENIFYIEYMENYFGCGYPQHSLSAKDGGWSLSNPTASLYEAYEFLDGTEFSYADSRYNSDNLGENRDPRLDYTIYYNGATFMGTEYVSRPDATENTSSSILDYSTQTSKTGYMPRKFFDENAISDLTSYSMVYPIIRYAEVLLSYLECLIESGANISQSDLDLTINAVRGRADVNMPAISVGDYDTDGLREKLRNERRVELALEGIRLWDIFRWGIAGDVLVGEVWGAPYPDCTNYADLTKNVDPDGYCRWYVGRRDFRDPQDYTWPIPQSEQNLNPNLSD